MSSNFSCSYMVMSTLTYNIIFLWYFFYEISHLNLTLLLWNLWTKFDCDGPWIVPFQNCIRQPTLHSSWRPLLKIEISLSIAIYNKSKLAQILAAAVLHYINSIFKIMCGAPILHPHSKIAGITVTKNLIKREREKKEI